MRRNLRMILASGTSEVVHDANVSLMVVYARQVRERVVQRLQVLWCSWDSCLQAVARVRELPG